MGWHKEWRKIVKKLRRKRIRSADAEQRKRLLQEELECQEKSPTHVAWLKEQEVLELFAQQEEERLAEERQRKWELEEVLAQERWRELQIRLEKARVEKAKQELLIREEWEREQKKIKDEEEQKHKEKEEKRKRQEELLAQVDAFISGKADLPSSSVVNTETQPGQPDCPFFSKTGACRFRDKCSRNHIRPGISRVLLITKFYEHFGIHSSVHNEYDTDVGLEYEDSETYSDFLLFYNDILPEFESCGEIRQLKVCCNHEPHLRGNVYIEYFNERNALKAYQQFQGRYYAGRQLSISFTTIPSWKNALCGLFHKQRCPKGRTCNFLHVFKNPNNAFRAADFDRSPMYSSESLSSRNRSRNTDNWRWSESPERRISDRSTRKHSRNDSYEKNKKRNSRERKRRSEDRFESTSKRKKRKKSKSRERMSPERSHRYRYHKENSLESDEEHRSCSEESRTRAGRRSKSSNNKSEKELYHKPLDFKDSDESEKKSKRKVNRTKTERDRKSKNTRSLSKMHEVSNISEKEERTPESG